MRLVTALVVVAAAGLVAAPAEGGKRFHHKPAGVKGVVLNSTCAGACMEPAPPPPTYTGPVTVTVRRASDGTQVAAQAISDGHFKMRVKRGSYDVSSVPPNPPSCQPTPQTVCPAQSQSAVIAPCMTGETSRVKVRRHHFTYLELHVQNVCIV